MKTHWQDLIDAIKENNYKLLSEHILKDDKEVIVAYNSIQNEIFKLRTDILPAHYSGNIYKARIILLASNPGFVENEMNDFYTAEKYIMQRIDDLTFANDSFPRNDEDRREKSDYWYKKLQHLIHDDLESVSKKIALLQFNPYHSIKFREIPMKYFNSNVNKPYLESQNFGFQILKKCIERGALIVVLRSKKAWFKAVPELIEHEENRMVLTIKNKRNPVLSPKNFDEVDSFEILKNKLNEKNG